MTNKIVALTGFLRKYDTYVDFADIGDVVWDKKSAVHVKLKKHGDLQSDGAIWAEWIMPDDVDEAFIEHLVETTAYVEVDDSNGETLVFTATPKDVGGVSFDDRSLDQYGEQPLPSPEPPADVNAANPLYGIF